jgi:hypothetical protein
VLGLAFEMAAATFWDVKTVHPSTRRAIIREYEKNTRVKLTIQGSAIYDVSLADLRLLNLFAGNGDSSLTFAFGEGTRITALMKVETDFKD